MKRKSDIIVLGAGLSGLISSIRLNQLGYSVTLVDNSLPEAKESLGGFAKFSGAKFSLPPAGLGLLNISDNIEDLNSTIEKVAALLNLTFSTTLKSSDISEKNEHLRKYESLVLDPNQIDALISCLTNRIVESDIVFVKGFCSSISTDSETLILSISQDGKISEVVAKTFFYAAGRLGENILEELNIQPTNFKGLDVGVRVEFPDTKGLDELRKIGPDAKIIKGNCRTFCLNTPGEIYRYPYKGISIPGGVVANTSSRNSNVGILLRTNDKKKTLNRTLKYAKSIPKAILEKPFKAENSIFGEALPHIIELYGNEIVDNLLNFCSYLGDNGVINWKDMHYIHIPLIDWHWSTYSLSNSFRSSRHNVYCVGDASGHARGLLQAAVSGWLAAEEYNKSES